ncbi:hypothetical protein D6C90_08211 [Aureobasidium pullulans]|nr:hypothetical protein D6C90_08211 [Aureobasidium pullulans]
MDASRIPCHLALRLILDSNSVTEAVDELKKFGVASSCHMLIADANGRVQELFKDEKNYPFAICRAEEQGNHSGTLFNIVMDLKARKASVILGRPTEPEGLYEIGF